MIFASKKTKTTKNIFDKKISATDIPIIDILTASINISTLRFL